MPILGLVHKGALALESQAHALHILVELGATFQNSTNESLCNI